MTAKDTVKKLAPEQRPPTATFRLFGVVLTTIFLALIIGIENVQRTPLLWAFLTVIFISRFLEAYSPAAHLMRSYRKDEDQSRWTTWVIGFGFITNMVFPMWEYRHGVQIFINFILPTINFSGRETPPPTQWWNWLGLLFLIGGSIMRLWAIKQAGTSFVPHVKVDSKLKLVSNGPYAYMRHPSYLGTVCSYLGIAMIFNSVIGSLALVVLVIPALLLRIAKEEQLLSNRFGDGWRKYQSQTPWRLIPRVW